MIFTITVNIIVFIILTLIYFVSTALVEAGNVTGKLTNETQGQYHDYRLIQNIVYALTASIGSFFLHGHHWAHFILIIIWAFGCDGLYNRVLWWKYSKGDWNFDSIDHSKPIPGFWVWKHLYPSWDWLCFAGCTGCMIIVSIF